MEEAFLLSKSALRRQRLNRLHMTDDLDNQESHTPLTPTEPVRSPFTVENSCFAVLAGANQKELAIMLMSLTPYDPIFTFEAAKQSNMQVYQKSSTEISPIILDSLIAFIAVIPGTLNRNIGVLEGGVIYQVLIASETSTVIYAIACKDSSWKGLGIFEAVRVFIKYTTSPTISEVAFLAHEQPLSSESPVYHRIRDILQSEGIQFYEEPRNWEISKNNGGTFKEKFYAISSDPVDSDSLYYSDEVEYPFGCGPALQSAVSLIPRELTQGISLKNLSEWTDEELQTIEMVTNWIAQYKK
jgi:hypothetical protein